MWQRWTCEARYDPKKGMTCGDSMHDSIHDKLEGKQKCMQKLDSECNQKEVEDQRFRRDKWKRTNTRRGYGNDGNDH